MAHCIVSSVGLDDCAASALIGHNRVLSIALPRKRNFTQLLNEMFSLCIEGWCC